jgi:uncharacterized membrane protein YgcG
MFPMNSFPLRLVASAWVALALLLAGARGHAATAGIRDQAGFFSESAESAAARTIAEIGKSAKKDLLIETYAEIPVEARRGVDLQDKAAVKRLFETWSVQRARELGINGIYVVMTREPAHLQVAVGNETQREAFTLADRDVLVGRMLERLRAKKNDEALSAGVGFVRDTLRAQAGASSGRTRADSRPVADRLPSPPRASAAEAPSRGFPLLSVLLPVLLLGLGVFVVVRVLRALMGGGTPGATSPALGGGGGFMRSMLGGLFGAAAGMWLYNMFAGHGSTAWGADAPPSPGGNADAVPPSDSDYSSSGGDFGDSSGGGDFGGGDFGGGGGDF